MTPTPAFLPLPVSFGCSPARQADAQPALLCSALVFIPAKEEKRLETPKYFAGPPSRLPKTVTVLSAALKLFVCILQSYI